MAGRAIPFNKAALVGPELRYIAEAVERGHISADGRFTDRCTRALEECLGTESVLLTTSCTDALEMAGLLLDLAPGDEVIVPSFSFVTTAGAFAMQGARPVFADIRPDTLNLDESRVAEQIGPRTRAIVVVHYAGVGCEMDAILALARRHGLAVIEDNAHGLFGRYRDRPLGSMGACATLSFHETKNVVCGEGGAIAVNEPGWRKRAEVIRQKGTNRMAFFRGEVDKYSWVDLGSSYAPSEILAAFLWAQLEQAERIQAARARIWNRYHEGLADWARAQGVERPNVPAHCDPAYHLYHLVMPSHQARSRLIEHLKACGILAVFHYLPLHRSDMARRLGSETDACPVSETVSERLVRLPFYTDLASDDQDSVIEAVRAFPVDASD